MARKYNQDYFKVSGSKAEDRDEAKQSRDRLTGDPASRPRPPRPRRPEGGAPAPRPHVRGEEVLERAAAEAQKVDAERRRRSQRRRPAPPARPAPERASTPPARPAPERASTPPAASRSSARPVQPARRFRPAEEAKEDTRRSAPSVDADQASPPVIVDPVGERPAIAVVPPPPPEAAGIDVEVGARPPDLPTAVVNVAVWSLAAAGAALGISTEALRRVAARVRPVSRVISSVRRSVRQWTGR